MRKPTLILIALVLAGFGFIVFAAWAKLTHKSYADDALTIAATLQIGGIAIAVVWVLYMALKKKRINL